MMRAATVLSIAHLEARMQFRRKYVWPVVAIVLFVIWFLVSPFNEPGTIYSADKLAARSMRLCIIFTSLLMAFLVSDRIIRDETLKVRECLIVKPINTRDYVLGKCLGNTVYCWCMFVLPIWVLVQVEQFVYAGGEYYDPIPFLKAYSFYPFLSALFIVCLSLWLATVLKDALKYFTFFTLLWCGVLFVMTPGSESFLRVFDFSGTAMIQIVFPLKNLPANDSSYIAFALNLAFLGLGSLAAVALAAFHLSREHVLNSVEATGRTGGSVYRSRIWTRSAFWYNGRIMHWGTFNGVLAAVIVMSAILLKGIGDDKVRVIHLYFEAILPLVFSFTTTHGFLQERNAGVLEILLSKPTSRARLLLDRHLFRLAPSILVTALLAVSAGMIYEDVDSMKLVLVSVTTVVFMSTLSMSAGLLTDDPRFGAVVTVLWFMLWMNTDIQQAIGSTRYWTLINPFVYGFHHDCCVLESKIALLVLTGAMLGVCCLFVNKAER